MILAIGEILADMTGERFGEDIKYTFHCGGAPFNLAVNAKRAGAKVGFIGRVGDDLIGKMIISYAQKANLDYLGLQVDMERNTTLAFVNISGGEREFCFYRKCTADSFIDVDSIDFNSFDGLNIVAVGSLMLSSGEGRKCAERIISKARSAGKLIAFDVNYRSDIYENFSLAQRAYSPLFDEADILKFSEDELFLFTGERDIFRGMDKISRKGRLVLVTLGNSGSAYCYDGRRGIVPVEKVKPIDTTGAGDAFFGTLLSRIDGKILDTKTIEDALIKANLAGAKATQFYGALKL